MDDLTSIKGIGPATAKRFQAAGIETFAQLAAFTTDDARAAPLGATKAQLAGWIGQAGEIVQQNTSQSDDQSGAGNLAGPAGGDPETNTSTQPEKGDGSAPDNGASVVPPIQSAWQELMDLGEEDARARWPHLIAAVDAFGAANKRGFETIRITARRDGFRRCNMAHTKAPAEHPADRFTPEELERLLTEPMLTVELV